MHLWKQSLFTLAFCLLLTTPALAAPMTVIAPYWGTEENVYFNPSYGLELEDSQFTRGLYIQSIDPAKYQWNLFYYRTENINYSDLWGLNFIYDRYFGAKGKTKNVWGAGFNYFTMDLAGTNIPTGMGLLPAFNLDLDVTSIYARAGRYYGFGGKALTGTVMPWIGGELDISRGEGFVDFPGPGAASFIIDDDQYSWIAGVNVKLTYHHFLQVEAKRSFLLNGDDYGNKASAMVNIFVSRHWGISYRYNYIESTVGKDSYSIFGIAGMF